MSLIDAGPLAVRMVDPNPTSSDQPPRRTMYAHGNKYISHSWRYLTYHSIQNQYILNSKTVNLVVNSWSLFVKRDSVN